MKKFYWLCTLVLVLVISVMYGCTSSRYYWENKEKTKCKDRKSGLYVLPEKCHAKG